MLFYTWASRVVTKPLPSPLEGESKRTVGRHSVGEGQWWSWETSSPRPGAEAGPSHLPAGGLKVGWGLWLFAQHSGTEVPVRKFVPRWICLLFTLAWRAAPWSPGFKHRSRREKGGHGLNSESPELGNNLGKQCLQFPEEEGEGLDSTGSCIR